LFCLSGDMTGRYSVYTIYEGHEIMFHVSTLLPYSKDNRQQVQMTLYCMLWKSFLIIKNYISYLQDFEHKIYYFFFIHRSLCSHETSLFHLDKIILNNWYALRKLGKIFFVYKNPVSPMNFTLWLFLINASKMLGCKLQLLPRTGRETSNSYYPKVQSPPVIAPRLASYWKLKACTAYWIWHWKVKCII
jgi:hypothetical protein